MSCFPSRAYEDGGAYASDYFSQLAAAAATVDTTQLGRACEMLGQVVSDGGTVFSCGNGGSAAVANHLVCDCLKGARSGTDIRPRVHSLSATVELITAIANDMSYEGIFSYQLESNARPGDLLIAISSSGMSPNILAAIRSAKSLGLKTVAMVGFSGGEAAALADIHLWVRAENYGIVEDVHQSLMHILAQFLRQSRIINAQLIGTTKF